MLDKFPLYSILAQSTMPEAGWVVEVRLAELDDPITGVSEQDIIDVLRDYFDAQPNVTVSVYKSDIVNTPA